MPVLITSIYDTGLVTKVVAEQKDTVSHCCLHNEILSQ
jgi:hypothetical protein